VTCHASSQSFRCFTLDIRALAASVSRGPWLLLARLHIVDNILEIFLQTFSWIPLTSPRSTPSPVITSNTMSKDSHGLNDFPEGYNLPSTSMDNLPIVNLGQVQSLIAGDGEWGSISLSPPAHNIFRLRSSRNRQCTSLICNE